MINVILINENKIPHYRIGVYNYLHEYLLDHGISLKVVSSGIQGEESSETRFQNVVTPLRFFKLFRIVLKLNPHVIIYWIRPRNYYLLPFLIGSKLLGFRLIYWGHGCNLYSKWKTWKKWIYDLQFLMSDALIIYAEHLKNFVRNRFHSKTFVANNTTYFNHEKITEIRKNLDRRGYLSKYNIKTTKNIICVGRMQKRKKIKDLIDAFCMIDSKEIGLILVGPDQDGVLKDVRHERIYKLGPVYGDEKIKLLCAADVFCLPGLVGLSIVDAFQCGLPFVTEEGPLTPEIMYLKDGVNGFIVPEGDIPKLSEKLRLLLEDNKLREEFSLAAEKEIFTAGHIDTMCKGFLGAIQFVCRE